MLTMLIWWVGNKYHKETQKHSLVVNTEKTKYMFVSRHQNTGQNQNYRLMINRLKNLHISNIWEQQ